MDLLFNPKLFISQNEEENVKAINLNVLIVLVALLILVIALLSSCCKAREHGPVVIP